MEPDRRESPVEPGAEPPSEARASGRVTECHEAPTLGSGFVLAGKYRIDHELGRGGMGTVYAATDVTTGMGFAVKVRLPRSPERRFTSEAIAAARIRHPNVIEVYDHGDDGEVSYLVMELLEGETLASLVKRGGLSVQEVLTLVLAAAHGVAAAHARGVVHRDLKPENIFVLRDGDSEARAKVLDFGIAKLEANAPAAHDAITQTGSLLGTPSYMSPEQLQTPERADARSDVYSLGVVLYEALTGQKPFPSSSYNVLILQISTARPLPPRQLNPRVPPAVAALVERAMAPDPRDRFQSMGELVTALQGVSTASAGEEPSPPPTLPLRTVEPPPRTLHGAWLVAGAVSLIALAVGFLGWTAYQRAAPSQPSSELVLPPPSPLITPPPDVLEGAASGAGAEPRDAPSSAAPPPIEAWPPASSAPSPRPARNKPRPNRERAVAQPPPAGPHEEDDWAGPLSPSELR